MKIGDPRQYSTSCVPSEAADAWYRELMKKESSEMPKDNWEYRTHGMTCQRCIFFVPKKTESPAGGIGRCRRHAPTMNGFPVVFVTDWCGDHKLDENKL